MHRDNYGEDGTSAEQEYNDAMGDGDADDGPIDLEQPLEFTSEQLAQELQHALEFFSGADDEEVPLLGNVASIKTYQEAGMLTMDAGLVLTFMDGSEYQLTLVQSRSAEV